MQSVVLQILNVVTMYLDTFIFAKEFETILLFQLCEINGHILTYRK